jgi:hypothetical protein
MGRKATLTMKDRGWTGWVREQPAEESLQLAVTEGNVLSHAIFGGAHEEPSEDSCMFYKLVVERITAEQVCFTYHGVVITNPGGGINLSAEPSGRFWLGLGRSKELATPTMDGGIIITVTVDAIE